MQWEQFTPRLIEAVIRRDEFEAARLSLELCRGSGGLEWSLIRYDFATDRFRRLWPANGQPDIANTLRTNRNRLEKGEVVVDNGEVERGKGEEAVSRSALFAPLIYQSQLLAVLQGTAAPGQAVTLEFLETLQGRIRLLSRTWFLVGLLDEKERLVFTDRLTRLYNSDYLVQFLEKELPRCARHRHNVAVVFLDVDWFKHVNDAHGHLVGSRVLRELGGLLRRSVRESDVVVRYGGDEFVVVLTETGEVGALELAERLRSKVQRHEFSRDIGKSIRFTISVGVAVYPRHGTRVADLIHQSDLAMYVAKHSQKNCVKLAV